MKYLAGVVIYSMFGTAAMSIVAEDFYKLSLMQMFGFYACIGIGEFIFKELRE